MPGKPSAPIRGRGSAENPPNRFESIEYLEDEEYIEEEDPSSATQFFRDASRSVIAYNDSPDVGHNAGLNPYRGCEHGCIYCYARPTHEYLGFSSGIDFETKILVKENAPELLRNELASPRWQPQPVAISGVTDPYQPIERRLQLTRRCLEVFAEYRNPIAAITKNFLVMRDVDILQDLAQHDAAEVLISVTTLDPNLTRILEPRTSAPRLRLKAIETFAEASIPVGVMVAPVIPGLTDHEISPIISAAVSAGASFAGYITLRLPHAVTELFENWLERHVPSRKDKVLNRIRSMRGGKLSDSRFHTRLKGEGPHAEQIADMFEVACRKAGIYDNRPTLSVDSFRRPSDDQIQLFD